MDSETIAKGAQRKTHRNGRSREGQLQTERQTEQIYFGTRREGQHQTESIYDVDSKTRSPILELWSRLSSSLRNALYGAFCQHGIVSTRKAIAAIRGVDEDVRAFLARLDEIAPGAEAIPSSQNSTPRAAPLSWKAMPSSFVCSSCVDAAAQSFLSNDDVEGYLPVIDSKAFFVCLVRVSTAHLLGMSTALVEAESKLNQSLGDLEGSGAPDTDYVMVD